MGTSGRTVLMVQGPARAGQSLVARVLMALGAEPGQPLAPPDLSDAIGGWRNRALAQANEALLAMRGLAWSSLRPVTSLVGAADSIPGHAALARALEALATAAAPESSLLLADPALGRLAPLYRDLVLAGGGQPVPILVLRPPLAQAAALVKYDHLPVDWAVALWIIHTADAVTAWPADTVSVVQPEALARDWQTGLAALPPAHWPAGHAPRQEAVAPLIRRLDKRAPPPLDERAVNPMLLALAEQCHQQLAASPLVGEGAREFLADARAHLQAMAAIGLSEGIDMAARILTGAGRAARAVTVLEGLAPVIQDHVGPWITLAGLHTRAERLASAQAAIDHARALAPEDPEVAAAESRLRVRQGQALVALQLIAEACGRHPYDEGLLTQWARLALPAGRAAEVAPELARRLGGVVPGPRLAKALAHLWAHLGRPEKAVEVLARCHGAYPDEEELGGLIATLQAVTAMTPGTPA